VPLRGAADVGPRGVARFDRDVCGTRCTRWRRGGSRIRAAAAYAFEVSDPVLAAFRTTPPRRKKKATTGEREG